MQEAVTVQGRPDLDAREVYIVARWEASSIKQHEGSSEDYPRERPEDRRAHREDRRALNDCQIEE